MRKIIIAICFAGIIGYCLFRILHVVQVTKSPSTEVECGRYYLDNGKQESYIDILTVDNAKNTFQITINGYNFPDTLKMVIDTYGTAMIGEVVTNDDGTILTIESESQCEEYAEEKKMLLKQQYQTYITQDVHTYYLVSEYDSVLGWYQYTDSECMNLFDLRYDPKRKLIAFDMYLWKMEEGAV